MFSPLGWLRIVAEEMRCVCDTGRRKDAIARAELIGRLVSSALDEFFMRIAVALYDQCTLVAHTDKRNEVAKIDNPDESEKDFFDIA